MYIEIKNLSFKYDNSAQNVLDQFSLDIKQGEIVAILGQSGCGKSTLLRLISGLEAPHQGSIMINGKIVVDDDVFIQPENRGVGMLFQDYALFPHMSVIQNIGFGLHKLHKKDRKKRVLEVLDLVNLKGYENRYPYELSGGQQQRVALARAIAPKPAILSMDEPFSNLDADLRSKIRLELKDILKKEGITCIFVTHDKADVDAISDKVIVIGNLNEKTTSSI